MPVDIIPGPPRPRTRPLSAEISYIAAMAERPFIDVNDFSRNRLVTEARPVTIADGRGLDPAPALEREGFAVLRQKLPPLDYRDSRAVVESYVPLLLDLVRDFTGADAVIGTDEPIIRRAAASEAGAVRPAPFVHTDFTAKGARDLLERSFPPGFPVEYPPTEAARLAAAIAGGCGAGCPYRRVLVIQTWRVITPPPHDVSFALCAADSVSQRDVVVGDYVVRFAESEEARSETAFYRHSGRHRWYHFPDIEPDEVLLFMGYDFVCPDAPMVPHTGFADPTCGPDAVGRASIETRTLAFFEA